MFIKTDRKDCMNPDRGVFCGLYKFYIMKSVITLLSVNISNFLKCLLIPGSVQEVQPIFTPVIRNKKSIPGNHTLRN